MINGKSAISNEHLAMKVQWSGSLVVKIMDDKTTRLQDYMTKQSDLRLRREISRTIENSEIRNPHSEIDIGWAGDKTGKRQRLFLNKVFEDISRAS